MRRAMIVSVGLAAASHAASADDVQYGLRLDSASSLQWRGATIYAQGSRSGALETTRGPILGIWTGPVPGTFVLQTEETLGLLVGRDVQPMVTVGPGTVVRTSRPETVWIGRTEQAATGPRLRIHEMKGASLGREAVDAPGELLDFDVSARGSLLYLTRHRQAYLSVAGDTMQIPLPASIEPIRIFIAKDETALSVLSRDALCTAIPERREWRCDVFNPARHAVVRQAWNGHVTLEALATR